MSIPGLNVAHHPARDAHDPEVDFVLTVGTHKIPIEVKYRQHVRPHDIAGLRAFLDRPAHHALFGLLITLEDGGAVADSCISPLSPSELRWMR